MPRSIEEIAARIDEATRAGFRGRLAARGLARNLIWSGGILPPGSPDFHPRLSSDLIAYGLALFDLGLQIRVQDRSHPSPNRAFERAGEAIESVVRDGDPTWNERGFYTVIAAAAYHLGHFSARAFSLFPSRTEALNLSPAERALTLLMRRDLNALRSAIFEWAADRGGFDATLATRFEAAGDDFDFEAALPLSLNTIFHKALAIFDFALESGSEEAVKTALGFLDEGIATAGDFNAVPFWWIFTIARHLIEDLWDQSLHVRLPNPPDVPPGSNWVALRRLFIAELLRRTRAEIDLWPSQLSAASRAFDMEDDLVAALPTSAGKTRIAEICILRALSLDLRVIFVTPLRALSAQTERTLRQTFGPLGFSVSSLYGASGATGDDVDSLRNRNIVVTTPEKLDFALRNDPTLIDDVGLIVLDEAHTIGAAEREIRYEVLVQRLLRRADAGQRRIVCLSAILPHGDQLQDFVSWIRQDIDGEAITCDWRPTRQRFGEIIWRNDHAVLTFRLENEQPFVDPFITPKEPLGRRRTPFPSGQQELTLACAWRLIEEGQTVLIYCPLRRSVIPLAETAIDLHQRGYLASLLEHEEHVLNDAMNIGREWLGEFHPAVQCLKLGVAVHHAQLPRPFLRAVEQLLRKQVLKVTIASPTLAQGLNLSATTVLFYSLIRNRKLIPGEEFANVSGRAGRAFVDVEGQVICVAPDAKHQRHWNNLLRAAKERDLRSGLYQLVWQFCEQIRQRKGFSAEQIIEYVLGNAAAWDAPKARVPVTEEQLKEQEAFEFKWTVDLACLDSALLSLIQQDVAVEELAHAIDEALQSSLWQRTLLREGEVVQRVARALLQGRARYIWQNSTAAQRKGYFAAGVSFATGRYLDEHAEALNKLLREGDAAFAAGEIEAAIAASIQFANVVFAIPPFRPDDMVANWEEIVRAWVSGESMSDLAGGKDAQVLEFIEGALVYRLVWAMEAVRVREFTVNPEDEHPHAGRAAVALETGTSNYSAALLIQAGLASRVAAIKAISDCEGTFHDFRGLRTWLKAEPVVVRHSDAEWPTPETANLWRTFVESFETTNTKKWNIQTLEFVVEWETEPPRPGTHVRVVHDKGRRETVIYSIELDRIGNVVPAFLDEPAGVLIAAVSSSAQRIAAEYLGPFDLARK
ncbi:MAG: hypothetical protein QOJ64_1675 [Acidobacteriota bacterium]|jgi:hypothetical protein|nr:hypothetical protein [Acidobacteriota bacterium]